MTTLYLVRHAQSIPDFSLAESDWVLSAEGEAQATRLPRQLHDIAATRLISSPYRRAIDTLRPLSQALALPIRTEPDLRERKLREGYIENWSDVVRGLWADLDTRMPNCESGTECRLRMTACLTALARELDGETLMVASHGNAIALFFNGLDAGFGHDAWKRMRNPDVFRLQYRNGQWHRDADFVFDING
ncbi:MAG TPA: histidine phosphatase family protein [Pseudomonadales bacterium]